MARQEDSVLITGACGFAGAALIRAWVESGAGHSFVGVDNFIRPGSETNRLALKRLGVKLLHADLRCASDVEALPGADVVVDAAAAPSVLAGVDGRTSSRQLVEHNLLGTMNVLEYCRRHRATFLLLSTSRVYSVRPLAALALRTVKGAFEPDPAEPMPPGLTAQGVSEGFPTAPPVSLYGTTKVASEQLALEYGAAHGFPVWITRCGVLAGAGQFGHPEQGIFSYWINSWLRKRPLKYLGFDGQGHQVRDCLHPADLVPLLEQQIRCVDADKPRVVNAAGGRDSARSLRQLSDWCRTRIGPHAVESDPASRPFDIPWLVLDATRARKAWNWAPTRSTDQILEEILVHAEAHPDWLGLSEPP
jgi:CDP-paratose 2-epimerase